VPLSADEIAAGKKAYSEIRYCDNARGLFIILGLCFSTYVLPIGLILLGGMHVRDHGKDLMGLAAVFPFLHGIFIPILAIGSGLLGQLFNYRRFKSRYADNLKLVEDLQQRHADELPYSLETEIQRKQRALLWRLDAFLSRKPVNG
jgi:hypothetical protein